MSDSLEARARKIQAGDRRSIARAISAAESGDPNSIPLLKRLFREARRACVVGVTGPPGAGKSTLVEKLAAVCRREGRRVGILAIDPTSPFSGGAVLGDRIRMQSLYGDEGIYIRSMATRGCLGGLAHGAADAVTVLEAAGYDTVFVETVGVGQDEVAIAGLADIVLLLIAPDAGDDVQAFKAGVMEIADVFVVNKADRGDASDAERHLRALLSAAAAPDGWQTPIVKTSALMGEGVQEALQAARDFCSYMEHTALGKQRARRRWRRRLGEMARQRLLNRLADQPENDSWLQDRVDQIMNRETDPYSVVEELVKNLSTEPLRH